MRVSLIIPAFNEAKKIGFDLDAASRYLESRSFDSEVLVINDGSQDDTQRVAEEISKKLSTDKVKFKVLNYGCNRGKGYAIRFGVKQAKGDLIAFADSGLCVPFSFLNQAISQIENGADFAVASRRLKETKIRREQPLYRKVGSKVFWFVVKGLMGVQVSDTQCGFKIYSKKAAQAIFERMKTDGFMFDIEALLIAKKLKLRHAEFAVEWSNDSDTRYHPVWGTLKNFRELSAIRFRSFYFYE
ncbi:MAG: glycosyltransferase [Bdellovibrionales bacterium]|nr:glycosyltransferase [Bdellovibrionales bacterium]